MKIPPPPTWLVSMVIAMVYFFFWMNANQKYSITIISFSAGVSFGFWMMNKLDKIIAKRLGNDDE